MKTIAEANRLAEILRDAIATIRDQGIAKLGGKYQLGGLDIHKNKVVEYNKALTELITLVNALYESNHELVKSTALHINLLHDSERIRQELMKELLALRSSNVV